VTLFRLTMDLHDTNEVWSYEIAAKYQFRISKYRKTARNILLDCEPQIGSGVNDHDKLIPPRHAPSPRSSGSVIPGTGIQYSIIHSFWSMLRID